MTLDELQKEVWQNANPDVVWAPDSAIYKKWLADKAGTAIHGVPIVVEQDLDGDEPGARAMTFQSGQIAVYHGEQNPQVTVH